MKLGLAAVGGLGTGIVVILASIFSVEETMQPEVVTVYVTPTVTPAWEPERLIATPISNMPAPTLEPTTPPPVPTIAPTPFIVPLAPVVPTPTPMPSTPSPTATAPTPTPCVPGRSHGQPPAYGFCA